MYSPGVRRVLIAAALLCIVVSSGGLAYSVLGNGTWTFGDALYFALITVSTVGYGELPDLSLVPGARALTGVLIVLGSASLVYFQSNITATLVEGRLGQALRRKRMENQIKAISGHVVVTGIGRTGKHVIEELVAVGKLFVVIDSDLDKLEALSLEMMGGKMLYVHGDATHDQTLIRAGIERAAGVIAALPSDRENLYVTLSARSLNANTRIVAKVVEAEARKKMLIAGANSTVSPNIIGGQRLASELVRPEVMQFLDQMMRDKDKNLRLEEISIPAESRYCGASLRDVPFRSAGNVLVIAVRDAKGTFIYNPGPAFAIKAGSVLVVLGETKGVATVHELVKKSMTAMSLPPRI